MRAPLGTRIHLCPAASHGHEVPTRTPVVPVGTHPSKPLYPPWAHSPFMPRMSQQSPWMQRACHHPSDPPLCVHTLSLLCSLIYPLLCYCSGPQTPLSAQDPLLATGCGAGMGLSQPPAGRTPRWGRTPTWMRLLPQSATMMLPLASTATPVGALNCPFPSPCDPNLKRNSPSALYTWG